MKKTNCTKRFISLFSALMMVITMLPKITFNAAADTVDSIVTLVDPDTSLSYNDDNFLGHAYSTEFAGRIWSNQTVKTIENSHDLLVQFSALATAKSVTGRTNAPLDVVFVIDTSGSMTDDVSNNDSTSRMAATINALNASIEKVMSINEYTRVAVVAFSDDSETLLPLGRYEKGTRQYTTGGYQNQQTITVNNFFSVVGSTLYKHVIPEGAAQQQTDNRSVDGGTNIQIGYAEGLNILANADSSVIINNKSIERVPALIFLSDGAPTFSSSSENWWNPSENSSDGPGSNPSGDNFYIGNGFKALMTAAYLKEAVNRNYANNISIYTVGMGINALQNAEQQLAYVTLAPNDHWNDNNNVANGFRRAWATYITNNGTPSVNVGDLNYFGFSSYYTDDYYTVNHPTDTAAQYDIDNNADALKNLVTDYYDAGDAISVTNVFDQIVSEIVLSLPDVPTEVKIDQTIETGGYLTYTNPLGKYMEIKGSSINILYEGVSYTATDPDGNGTYTFENNTLVKGSDGKDYDLNNILITAADDAEGFLTVTVKIPAILIPLRINSVSLDENGNVLSHTHNGELPGQLSYVVGIIPDILDAEKGHIRIIPQNSDGSAWSGEKLAAYNAYLAENIDPETGTINFYASLFTGEETLVNNKTGIAHTVGNATATFEPSHSNAFYYVQKKIPIYLDEAMTILATAETLDENTTYYLKETFYHEDDIEIKAVARTGHQLSLVEIAQDESGQWYRVPGSIRLNKLQLFEGQKTANITGTAEDFYASHYNETIPTYEHFVIHFGNNGLVKASVTGALQISKTVSAGEGLQQPQKTFHMQVNLTGVAADDQFSYKVVNANGETVFTGLLKTGEAVAIKAGEKAVIGNIPANVTYTIEEREANQSGFTTTYINATGTIQAGTTAQVTVHNHYSAQQIAINSGEFKVQKNLTGRDWQTGDSFTFILESNRPTTPMPANAIPIPNAQAPSHYVIEAVATNADPISFGSITFTVPGTYVYTISERVPTPSIAGISYSAALYQLTVVIADNGEGALTKSVSMQQLRDDLGTPDNLQAVVNNTAVFTNTFHTTSVEWIPVGTKDYKDITGTNPLTNGMFSFKMSINPQSPANTPMPQSAGSLNYTVDENIGPQIGFDAIEFTQDHVNSNSTRENPTSYYYDFQEVIPEGAQEVAPGKWELNGMVYDGLKHTVQVNVYYVTAQDGALEIVVEPIYGTMADGSQYNQLVFFNEYTPEPVHASLSGEKVLEGREWTANDRFNFTLKTNDSATQAAIRAGAITGVNAQDMSNLGTTYADKDNKEFTIAQMTFATTGAYLFQIVETQGSTPGMKYDNHVTDVTVVVAPDPDNIGSMKITVTYDNKHISQNTQKAVFVNRYEVASSAPVTVTAAKKLTGRDMHAGEFFVNVEALNNAPLGGSHPGNALPAAKDGVVSAQIEVLNNIVYTEPGVYEYLIVEHIPAEGHRHGGITYDETVYRVKITVTDNSQGSLVTETLIFKSEDGGNTYMPNAVDEIIFYNSYKTKNAVYTPFHLWKVLENKSLTTGDFTFLMEAVQNDGGMILPQKTIVTHDVTGEIIFDDITFTKPGVYQIKVTEQIPEGATRGADGRYYFNGVSYSNNEIIEEFTVTDNGQGSLVVSRRIVSGSLIFTNTYRPMDNELVITGTKVYNGGMPLENGMFMVGLYDENNTLIAKAPVLANGTFTFDPIQISIEDVGTTTYTVKEIIPADAVDNGNGTKTKDNIIYDASVYTVQINVPNEQEDSSLTVEKTILLNQVEKNEIVFTNTFIPDSIQYTPIAQKSYNKELKGNDFLFTLTGDVDGTPIQQTKYNDAEGRITFDPITFKQAGTYTFTVKETGKILGYISYSSAEYKVTVTVVNDNGVLRVQTTCENTKGTQETDLVFVNTYLFDGEDQVVLEGTKVLTGDRTSVNNEEFTFGLYDADGKLLYTAKNDAQGKFRFEALKFNESHTDIDGESKYTYTVKEIAGTDPNMTYDETVYTIEITVKDNHVGGVDVSYVLKNGEKIVFTNTYEEQETPVLPDNPPTSDPFNMALWIALFCISGGALITLTTAEQKKKQTKA